jgi:hypothetical protein
MMSKFEMALLTVTVVGTLVAWPTLQQDSLLHPTDGATGLACSARASAFPDVRPARDEERAARDRASRTARMSQPSVAMPWSRAPFLERLAGSSTGGSSAPDQMFAPAVAFRRDIVRNTHGQ